MTQKEKQLIEDIAYICTSRQDESTENVFIAHALWSISQGDIKTARENVNDLARITETPL